ncbi:SRPBCC family protein [Hyunsoonleella pacifica]|uniref:SRPBCC domain-containing protein n=1 Tax=Hyunsoonleella pacifica TaxID=1080224 RepID=A0A4Q9FPF0_9FLAO|nr:SRPBCC domain-containing protein [Hyunsoonleella pacifica]TBN15663.1 SRPBCC domain-containing protein [Hyunsoonleella pacifica]GGD21652.1 hypothetical protein GCM10011368_24570 [Hyunsoonleella pacifica]
MNKNSNYSQEIKINTSPKTVFEALNEGMDIWWGAISNSNFKSNGKFTITFENGYWWAFKITEFIPYQKLTWKCIDGEPEFNKEWIGHELHWDIKEVNQKTILNFHQIGLTPQLHCYEVCSTTWDMFITQKLKSYINKKSSTM